MKKSNKVITITKINLNWGHNQQLAVFKNNSLEYDGNSYDAGGSGDFEKTVSDLLLKNKSNKVEIVEINEISKISQTHKKTLIKSNSDWSDSFSS